MREFKPDGQQGNQVNPCVQGLLRAFLKSQLGSSEPRALVAGLDLGRRNLARKVRTTVLGLDVN